MPLVFAFGTFISTLCGGLFGLKNRQRLHDIISFTAGVLIAVAFFDIIPEMFSIATEHGFDVSNGLIAVVIGFLLIHILEKTAVIHGAHEEEYATHRHPVVGRISAAGLSFHSFLDGVGIGLGFHVNAHVGALVALAVIAHDFSDGLNTVSLMLINKNTQRSAVGFLILDAVTPLLGVLVTYLIAVPEQILMLYLGFFAGFLLYIGASDLLPEAHSEHSSWKLIALTLCGVLFIFIVTRFV